MLFSCWKKKAEQWEINRLNESSWKLLYSLWWITQVQIFTLFSSCWLRTWKLFFSVARRSFFRFTSSSSSWHCLNRVSVFWTLIMGSRWVYSFHHCHFFSMNEMRTFFWMQRMAVSWTRFFSAAFWERKRRQLDCSLTIKLLSFLSRWSSSLLRTPALKKI